MGIPLTHLAVFRIGGKHFEFFASMHSSEVAAAVYARAGLIAVLLAAAIWLLFRSGGPRWKFALPAMGLIIPLVVFGEAFEMAIAREIFEFTCPGDTFGFWTWPSPFIAPSLGVVIAVPIGVGLVFLFRKWGNEGKVP